VATVATDTETRVDIDELRTLGLEEDLAHLAASISGSPPEGRPNVAVVSPPLAGRDRVLDYAAEQAPSTTDRVRFSSISTDSNVFDGLGSDIQLMDNCQFLYRRRIGGFDVLDTVLDEIVRSDTVVVSSWNSYAWDYLVDVKSIDRVFPVQIELPALTPAQTAALITTTYDTDGLRFVDDRDPDSGSPLEMTTYDVAIGTDRSITVPLPTLNRTVVRSWRTADEAVDIRDLIFERIAARSNGNPGVAKAIWEQSVDNGTISLTDIEEPPRDIELTDVEAFALRILLTKERLAPDVLASIINESAIDRILQSLVQQHLVERDGGQVTIRPMALSTIVTELDRRRLL
jgi:hypothetical protein